VPDPIKLTESGTARPPPPPQSPFPFERTEDGPRLGMRKDSLVRWVRRVKSKIGLGKETRESL